MLCVVSVVDSISATSMPINEFVIYRSVHNYELHQILIVCDTKASEDVIIPDDVEVYLVGTDCWKIRNIVKRIQKNVYQGSVVYHMHHQRSALVFLCATVFLGTKRHSLFTVHSTFGRRDLKYRLSSSICVLLSHYANCVSNAAYLEYASIIKKIKGSNFTYIPNGVDVERIDKVIECNTVKKDRKTLVYVGRMIPLKNHSFLIKLMKYLQEYRLILIGAGEHEEEIRSLAKKLDVDGRVEFKGMMSRDDVFRELGNASIYVSPSYVEGLPVSVLEAMRAGLIPVISDIMPHKEIAERCGSVRVLPLNGKIWVKEIKQIGTMPDEDFLTEIDRIKEAVQKRFSLDKMQKQYLEVYRKLN